MHRASAPRLSKPHLYPASHPLRAAPTNPCSFLSTPHHVGPVTADWPGKAWPRLPFGRLAEIPPPLLLARRARQEKGTTKNKTMNINTKARASRGEAGRRRGGWDVLSHTSAPLGHG